MTRMITSDDIKALEYVIENEEYLMPEGEKSSWPRTFYIYHFFANSNKSLGIYMNITKLASGIFHKVVSICSHLEGKSTNEFLAGLVWDGLLRKAREHMEPTDEMARRLEYEVKISMSKDLEAHLKLAKQVLSPEEFEDYCKLSEIKPDDYKLQRRASIKEKVMEWAYKHHLQQSSGPIETWIEDAKKSGVIGESKESNLRKLMSEWGVSGGARGHWNFDNLSPEIVAQMDAYKPQN